MPHINATNETDLLFAQGFVHAQNRFFQMDFQRCPVAGRLPEIFGQATLVADCRMRVIGMERTADFLAERQGPDMQSSAWGHFHQLTFDHTLGRIKPLESIFSRGPYPVGGNTNTLWATASPLDRANANEGMVGPPFRFITDLSDLNQSLGLLAPGQSGQVGSPHYDDQVDAWFKGGYHPMLYRREDVVKEQEACLLLLP